MHIYLHNNFRAMYIQKLTEVILSSIENVGPCHHGTVRTPDADEA